VSPPNIYPNIPARNSLFPLSRSGLNPTPTEAQNRAVDKLHQKLQVKLKSSFKKANEHEEEIQFDLKAHKRVILFEGKVMKKSKFLGYWVPIVRGRPL
jgi:hypothetical protein